MNGNDFVEDVFIRMIEMLIAKTDYIMLADKFLPIGMKAPLILVSAPNRCETEMSSWPNELLLFYVFNCAWNHNSDTINANGYQTEIF